MGKWSDLAGQKKEPEKQPGKWAAYRDQQNVIPDQPAPQEFSFGQMARNVPGSAAQFAKDIVTPIMHPIQTGKSLAYLAEGLAQKLVPGEQEHEKYVDQVGQFLKDRYGSVDAFKQTMMNDPVGAAADMALLLTGGGAAVRGAGAAGKVANLSKAGKAVTATGRALEPINLVKQAVKPVSKMIPKKTPRNLYESATKLSTAKLTDIERARLANTAVTQGIMPTPGGINKIRRKTSALNKKITKYIDKAQAEGHKIPTKRLFKEFNALKENARLSGKPMTAQRAINNIRKQIIKANTKIEKVKTKKKVVSSVLDEKGVPYNVTKEVTKRKKTVKPLTPKEAQQMKQNIYKETESYYSSMKDSPTAVKAQHAVARGAKEALEEIYPEIKPLNALEGDLINLRKNIMPSVNRIANRDLLGIGVPIKGTAGGVVGGVPGAVLGTAIGMVDAPTNKARLALILEQLRTAQLKNKTIPTLMHETPFQVGRMVDEGLLAP